VSDELLEILKKAYRPSRFQDRGDSYMDAVLKSKIKDLELYGRTFISHHDEISGRGVIIDSALTVTQMDRIERRASDSRLTHIF
jgi:hypothetical protein